MEIQYIQNPEQIDELTRVFYKSRYFSRQSFIDRGLPGYGSHLLIAKVGGNIAGALIWEVVPMRLCMRIAFVEVLECYKGHRVGVKMILEAEKYQTMVAKSIGYLDNPDNSSSEHMFCNAGYHRVDSLLFEKNLKLRRGINSTQLGT